MPKVSVIIPCYNHGAYLPEALDSVRAQSFTDHEVIVVNDGSTDEPTNRFCEALGGRGLQVINTSNQGLAAARNTGISAAAGDYILPLDADDRIGPRYIEEAVNILDREPQTGIVYCRARLFGAVETEWALPDYSLEEMLKDNIIFCTALFRRSDWELVGGYDPGMIYGWEDYDFWLALIERGREVRRLPKTHFYYRVAADSMVRSKEKQQKIEMFKRIYQRHRELIGEHIEVWLSELLDTRERYHTCRLYVDCGRGVNDADSIARKIDPGTRSVSFDITAFKGRRALRFDPVDCPVCLNVKGISLESQEGPEAFDLKRLTSNALYRQGDRFMFDSDDPQIFLHVSPECLESLVRIHISVDYQALEHEALQQVIEAQKNMISSRRKFSLPAWFKGG